MSGQEKRKNIERLVFLSLFCLTIPAANWMIGHVGTVCNANGPCLVPVAPDILAHLASSSGSPSTLEFLPGQIVG